jgi:HAMP domain-containing protein
MRVVEAVFLGFLLLAVLLVGTGAAAIWRLYTLEAQLEQLPAEAGGPIAEARERALRQVRSGVQWMAVLGVIGLVGTYAYGHILAQTLIKPLRQMLLQTRRIAQGDLFLRLPTDRTDEFGQMAIEINRIVDQLDQLNQQRDAFRAQRQQIAQALLDQYAGPALIFDLRDQLTLSNTAGRMLLLTASWQMDLEKIQGSLRRGEFVQAHIELADGIFRMNQAPMRDRQGNLLGTLVTLFLVQAEAPAAASPEPQGLTPAAASEPSAEPAKDAAAS